MTAKAKQQKSIVIKIEGGVVQSVSNVPKGFEIEVHDYDTPQDAGCDEETVSELEDDGFEFHKDAERFLQANARGGSGVK